MCDSPAVATVATVTVIVAVSVISAVIPAQRRPGLQTSTGGVARFGLLTRDGDRHVREWHGNRCLGLVHGDAHPPHTIRQQDGIGDLLRQMFDEVAMLAVDHRDDALGDLRIAHRVGKVVAAARVMHVDPHHGIDHERLRFVVFRLQHSVRAVGLHTGEGDDVQLCHEILLADLPIPFLLSVALCL